MLVRDKFYINGQWVSPIGADMAEIINPATEEVVAKVASGNELDIDAAVMAARTRLAKEAGMKVMTLLKKKITPKQAVYRMKLLATPYT